MWQSRKEDDGRHHVVPLDDLRDHEPIDETCWCRPLVEDGIVIHNSMDRREEFERGERKAS